MEQITLRFIGDLNAIGLANNLLSAALDKARPAGNALGIDRRRIAWTRVPLWGPGTRSRFDMTASARSSVENAA